MRRGLIASMLASLLLGMTAPLAFAECMDLPIGVNDPINVHYVFEATVTDASDAVDPSKPGNALYNWHVDMAVTDVYRGQVPDKFTYDGWMAGCDMLRGDRLTAGDQLLIATQRLGYRSTFYDEPAYQFDDPFWGDVLVWRKVGSTWSFYAEALNSGSVLQYYPNAAREATTTAGILDLLGVMPDTSTAPAERPEQPVSDLALPALIFLATTLVFATRQLLASPS